MSAPAVNRVPIDPNAGIPDLVRNLADDSKRLLADEVRLAKLETKENLQEAAKGAVWLALAFGVGVVTLVALTLMLATLIGQLVRGHMWVGAVITGVIELVVAFFLIRKGIKAFATDAYTLPETRETAMELASWARHPQQSQPLQPQR